MEKPWSERDVGTGSIGRDALGGWGFSFAFGVFWCWREVYFCIFVGFFFLSLYFPSFIRENNYYHSQGIVIQLSKVCLSVAVKKRSKQKWWTL